MNRRIRGTSGAARRAAILGSSGQPALRTTLLHPCAWLILALVQTGCVYVPTKVPDTWQQAMHRPAPSIAGTYQTSGEQTVKEGGYRIVRGDLAAVFNAVRADRSFCPPAEAIRLRPVGTDQLEITALQGGEAIATKMIAADVGEETSIDGVKVERQNNRKHSSISNLKTHDDAVLIKGADGFLYVQGKHRATATLGGVLPFGGGGETWLRFPPVP